MGDGTKKRRFFDENGKDAGGLTAQAFIDQSAGTGFSVDPASGAVLVSDGPLSRQYMRYQQHMDQVHRVGTTEHKQWMSERARLLNFMNESGRYSTEPTPENGTALYWQGRNYQGKMANRAVKLATAARPGLRPSDFGSAEPGMLGPELTEDLLSDQFVRLYRLVLGGQSIAEPTSDDRAALEYKSKLEEAGRIVGGRE